MVQYPRSYQRDKWIIEKEQNKSHAGQSDLYLKNKSNLFLWQVQSDALCFNFASPIGDCCTILEPRLDE